MIGRPGIDYIGVGVGALIFNDEQKLLMAQRGPAAKNERGKWEIPGGAVGYGETLEAALQREVWEEMGVKIEIVKPFGFWDHLIPDEAQHWVAPTYICKIVEGVPEIKEPAKCSQIGWFTLEEAAQLPLALVTQKDIAALSAQK